MYQKHFTSVKHWELETLKSFFMGQKYFIIKNILLLVLSIGSLEPLENSVHFLDLPSAWTVPQVSSGMVLLCMHSALVPVPIVCSFALRGVAVSAVKRLGRSQSATGLSICGGSSLLLRSTASSSADEEDQPSLSTPHSLTHKHTHSGQADIYRVLLQMGSLTHNETTICL